MSCTHAVYVTIPLIKWLSGSHAAPGCGVVASGWTAREAGLVREAVRPGSGTARQTGFA
jgi:hypothetical protein